MFSIGSPRILLTFIALAAFAPTGSLAQDEPPADAGRPCGDAATGTPVASGADSVGQVLAELAPPDAGVDPAPPPAPRERRYTIYGYNDDSTSVVLTDSDLLSFLDGSGVERLRADDIALVRSMPRQSRYLRGWLGRTVTA